MRDYAKVSPQFWSGKTGRMIRGNIEAQLIALYLMTSPHSNMIGVFTCPLVYMSHETGLPLQGASKGLNSLIEAGFCSYDHALDLVWVHEMARFQVDEALKHNDLRVKGVLREYLAIPKCPLRKDFHQKYAANFLLPDEDFSSDEFNPFEAPLKPLVSQEQEQEQEQEQAQEQFPAVVPTPSPKKRSEANPINVETWQSYAVAYFNRYGVDPVRNATVNGQIANFVKRLGEHAPHVAAFYVDHSNSYYLTKGHAVGPMLMDAEKLHTEWATGRRVTQTAARQADRTQTNFENSKIALDMLNAKYGGSDETA